MTKWHVAFKGPENWKIVEAMYIVYDWRDKWLAFWDDKDTYEKGEAPKAAFLRKRVEYVIRGERANENS